MQRRDWSRGKEAVIREIRKRRRDGASLSGGTVSREDGGLYMNARKYFGRGGWKKALRATGYSERNAFRRKPYRTKTWFKMMLRSLRRAGIPIHEQYLRKNGFRAVFEAGVNLYGTWRKAVESLGIKYENVRQRNYDWAPQKVIAEIRRLKRNGVPLHFTFIIKARGDLYGAAYVHCGSWAKAVTAAGFDYLKECKRVSLRRWLQSLSDGEIDGLQKQMMDCTEERRHHVRHKRSATRGGSANTHSESP